LIVHTYNCSIVVLHYMLYAILEFSLNPEYNNKGLGLESTSATQAIAPRFLPSQGFLMVK